MDTDTITQVPEEYKVYKQRFLVLIASVTISISNSVLWMSYAPVSTVAAEYFEVETSLINWFTLVFYLCTIPLVFASTYMLNKLGLRWTLQIGSGLSCAGAMIRAVSTSGAIEDKHTQYGVALFGQILAAMAQSFVMFVPAKLSQVWFPQTQRALATTVLSMGYNLGIVVAQASVPYIVDGPSDIPKNHNTWCAFSIVAEVFALAFITRDKPKTPPSRSAEKSDSGRPPYLSQLRTVITNKAYVILMLSFGAGIGVVTSITALTQQILCPLGYTKEFCGMTISILFGCGFVGAGIFGRLLDRTKKYLEIVKILYGVTCIFIVLMLELYLVPNMETGIAIAAALAGFFGIGGFATGFELGVEITYPVEESISTGFIFLSAQFNGAALVALIPPLATSQRSEYRILNTCSVGGTYDPKDYTIPAMVLFGYLCTMIIIMILFLKTRYHRQEADQAVSKVPQTNGKANKAYEFSEQNAEKIT